MTRRRGGRGRLLLRLVLRAEIVARAHLDQAADGAVELAGLGAFLAWLSAAETEERGLEAPLGEVSPDAIQVLTVHAAKGLEWDAVAVPGLVEGTFPDGTKLVTIHPPIR